MMTKEEVDRKLAEILGKKYEPANKVESTLSRHNSKSVSGREGERNEHGEIQILSNNDESIQGVEDDEVYDGDNGNSQTELLHTTQNDSCSDEVKAYVEMFGAKTVIKGKLLDGREMTRKEYLKYTKDLTKNQLFEHPLMYLMFRSENQVEANFHAWADQFEA